MSDPVSALAGARAADAVIGIEETGLRGMITVRADLHGVAVGNALDYVLGLKAPEPLRLTRAGDATAIWMSPDEILLLLPHAVVDEKVAALETALSGAHHMVVNVSDARAVLRLSGPLVGEVLAKGAPCDVSDRGFPPGTARRTHLGGLAVGIWRLEDELWEIVAFRSYAHHLLAWLEQAAMPGAEVGY